MPAQKMVYTPLPDDDMVDEEALEKLLPANRNARSISKPASHRRPWLVHLGIFSLYTIVFLALSTPFLGQNPKSLKEVCALEDSLYSPALEAIEYSIIRFNGTLDLPSPYKGHRSPAVDEAWSRITTNNSLWPIRMSDEELGKINKGGRASNVRYHEADGGGNMGTIEIFHQLHCLNMVRKYTYITEYPDLQELSNTRPNFLRSHLDHCIDIIRQRLMCTADVGVISYDWLAGRDKPFPDLDTYHKCRNFDAILDWTSKNRVHIPQEHMTRIGDEIDLPEWHAPDS